MTVPLLCTSLFYAKHKKYLLHILCTRRFFFVLVYLNRRVFVMGQATLGWFFAIFKRDHSGSSIAVLLCSCVCGSICGVCVFLICSSSLLLLVPREGCDCGISWVTSHIFFFCLLSFHFLTIAKRSCNLRSLFLTMVRRSYHLRFHFFLTIVKRSYHPRFCF